MRETLFRDEVLKKRQTNFGNVIISSSPSYWLITCLISVIVFGALTFVLTIDYAKKSLVTGFLVPEAGLVEILSDQDGFISSMEHKIGDSVLKNEEILSIKTKQNDRNEILNTDVVLKQLSIEKERLQKKRTLVVKRGELQTEQLKKRISVLEGEAQNIVESINLQTTLVESERLILKKYEGLLLANASTELEYSTRNASKIQAEKELIRLKTERKRFIDQSNELESEEVLLPFDIANELSDIEREIYLLDKSITEAEGGSFYTLNSPVDGHIAAVNISEGQIVKAKEIVATIIPLNSLLEARLLVPSRAVAFVRKGQIVEVSYEAFPSQKFGTFKGRIKSISGTTKTTNQSVDRLERPEPVYSVVVVLEDQNVSYNENTFPLQSGMALTADIVLEKRKIWEWLTSTVFHQ